MPWWPEDEWRRMWNGDECAMCADAPLPTNPFGDLILERDWSFIRLCRNQTQAGYSVVIAKRHAPEAQWNERVEAVRAAVVATISG